MVEWVDAPPEWAQAHLQQCAECAAAWRREQAYHRAVQAVRRTPVPACPVRWEQVQAQLTARAVRQRTIRWRFTLAGACATTLASMLVIAGWLLYAPERPAPPTLATRTPADQSPRVMASRPAHPAGQNPLPQRSEGADQSLTSSGSERVNPSLSPSGGKSTGERFTRIATPEPRAEESKALSPSGEEGTGEGTAPGGAIMLHAGEGTTLPESALNSPFADTQGRKRGATPAEALAFAAPRTSEPRAAGKPNATAAVAALPLPSLRPEVSENTDYLPIQYSGAEVNHVYSF